MVDYNRRIVGALMSGFACLAFLYFIYFTITLSKLRSEKTDADKETNRFRLKLYAAIIGISIFLVLLGKYIYKILPVPLAAPVAPAGVQMNPLLVQQLQNAARRDPVVIPFPANLRGENNVDPITLNRYEVNKTYVELPKARGTNQKFYVNRDQAIEMFTQRVVSMFDDQKMFTPNNVRVVKFSSSD